MATNQRMLQVDNTTATKGAVAGGSKSDTSRLSAAYPDGPQYVTTPSTISSIDGNAPQADVSMSPAEYRTAYKKACMIGVTTNAQEFDKPIDMSYGSTDSSAEPSPPNLLFLSTPGFPSKESTDFETSQGTDGSTIAASGRGPNVNPILNLDGIPDTENNSMADPKPDLIPVSLSPSTTVPDLAASEDDPPVDDAGSSGA